MNLCTHCFCRATEFIEAKMMHPPLWMTAASALEQVRWGFFPFSPRSPLLSSSKTSPRWLPCTASTRFAAAEALLIPTDDRKCDPECCEQYICFPFALSVVAVQQGTPCAVTFFLLCSCAFTFSTFLYFFLTFYSSTIPHFSFTALPSSSLPDLGVAAFESAFFCFVWIVPCCVTPTPISFIV